MATKNKSTKEGNFYGYLVGGMIALAALSAVGAVAVKYGHFGKYTPPAAPVHILRAGE